MLVRVPGPGPASLSPSPPQFDDRRRQLAFLPTLIRAQLALHRDRDPGLEAGPGQPLAGPGLRVPGRAAAPGGRRTRRDRDTSPAVGRENFKGRP